MTAYASHLLGRDEGLLQHALAPVAGASATARTTGPAAARLLVVDIAAPPEGIDEAVRLSSALVARVSRGEVPDGELVAAGRSFARAEREALGDPAERAARLFEGASAAPRPAPAPPAFRAFAARALAADRAAVTVVRPE